MINIEEMDLIAGNDIPCRDICRVRQPVLKDIKNIGYNTYQDYLSILLIDKDSLIKSLGIEVSDEVNDIPLYAIIGAIPGLRESYVNSLSFFTAPEDRISWRRNRFEINGIFASTEILEDIAAIVAKISNIEKDTSSQHVFASEKARKIWEKCQKGKQELSKTKKEDVNLAIPNVISSVSASNSGYTLLNIWELTVYQLYDQFSRINRKIQMDIYSSRWAAWGQDEFDTSIWFKNSLIKEG